MTDGTIPPVSSPPGPAAAYALTGLQGGMLYHYLTASIPGEDVGQVFCTFEQTVEPEKLRAAWDAAAGRHDAMRTAMAWEGLQAPEQRVFDSVAIPWQYEDLVGAAAEAQSERLAAFLAADRLRGFRLDEPPLMRLALFRLGPAQFQLIWTVHHIILDGRSRTLVLRDVFAAYDAACRGERWGTDREPRPFRDFIESLAGRDSSADRAFWKEALSGFSTPTRLSGVRPVAPAATGPRTIALHAALPPDAGERLNTLARENGLTLTTLVQGTWALILNRHSGESDVAFGVVLAGRSPALSGSESMVGMLINTLPLRTGVPAEAELIPWLRGVRERWRAMRDHEQTPLAEIQRASEFGAGRALFDTLVVVERRSIDHALRTSSPDWAGRSVRSVGQTSFPAALFAHGEPEIGFRLEFDPARLDQAAAARVLGQVCRVLEAIAADPSLRLGDVPITGDAEREQLLRQWNDTARPFPGTSAVTDLIMAQVERTPDTVAVRGEHGALTYRALAADATMLAAHLQSLGVRPGSLVGLFLERSPDLVVGMLGIMLAGAAYVPVDPRYPPDRIRDVFADAEASVVVTDEILREARHAVRAPAALPRVAPEDLAYVIFTSGSTGRPKGVQISHRSVVNFLLSMTHAPGLASSDVVVAITTPAFDIAVLELLLPLTVGAQTVIAPAEVTVDGTRLAALLDESGATVMQATPATWRLLLDAGWTGRRSLTALCGGEALPPELAASLLERCAALWNMYGPTETTVWSAIDRVHAGAPIVIGAPIANTQLHVLDGRLEPVPVGVPGELYIGGEGLARGYHNRPDLTAERFIQSPFDAPSVRLYRTGDIVRRRADGTMDFVGRADNQVKLRGYRIELGEIESVLGQAPGVAGAAAALRPGPGGHPRLVGYYIAAPGAAPADSDLRDALRRHLPDYMVPAVLMRLDAFPLTPAGKLDRKSLPEPPVVAGARTGDRTDNVRDELAHIWEELLGISQVGAQDNFFDLGGHSLLAVQLLQRITASFGRSITLNDLFREPTIDHVADVLTAGELAETPEPLVRMREGSGPPLFFLHGDFAFGGLYCNRLAKHLTTGRPVYVLHPHQPGGPDTIETMAADYADRIQQVEPQGPYWLAGVCNGGVIGFELARQLEERGERVERLVMINARADNVTLRPMLEMLDRAGRAAGWSPQRRRTYLTWQRPALLDFLDRHPRIASGSGTVRRLVAGAVLARLTARRLWRVISRRRSNGVAGALVRESTASPVEIAQHDRQRHIAAAMHSYLPSSYGGPVTLVWAEEEFESLRRDQLLGWETVTTGAEVRIIPGGHHTILTRHIAGLGATLTELLDQPGTR